MSILSIFLTIAGFIAGITAVTELLKQLFKITDDRWQQWTSWIVAVVLGCIGFATQTGIFAEFGTPDMWTGWVITVLSSFFCGLASNGFFDIKTVEAIIRAIEALFKTKTSK